MTDYCKPKKIVMIVAATVLDVVYLQVITPPPDMQLLMWEMHSFPSQSVGKIRSSLNLYSGDKGTSLLYSTKHQLVLYIDYCIVNWTH